MWRVPDVHTQLHMARALARPACWIDYLPAPHLGAQQGSPHAYCMRLLCFCVLCGFEYVFVYWPAIQMRYTHHNSFIPNTHLGRASRFFLYMYSKKRVTRNNIFTNFGLVKKHIHPHKHTSEWLAQGWLVITEKVEPHISNRKQYIGLNRNFWGYNAALHNVVNPKIYV